MSLTTWKKEFYPVTANECPQDGRSALKHAILKWTGLLPENMKKHRIVKSLPGTTYIRYKNSGHRFPITGSTCALCYNPCICCPIVLLGNVPCGDQYCKWTATGDPKPMLKLLKTTLKTAYGRVQKKAGKGKCQKKKEN